MTIKENLQAAKQLLIEKGWTQHASARLEDGTKCAADDPHACCFCLGGAICRVAGEYMPGTASKYIPAWRFISGFVAGNTSYCGAINFNDEVGRTKEEVIALLDKAIAEAPQ